jgi:prepilin-type N-terminal cleavage/methylation domain-containing protein
VETPAAGSRRYDRSCAPGRSSQSNAFTLLELIVSLAVSSILLAGVGSSVFLALRASDVSLGSASQVRAAHEALLRIARDVEYAVSVQSSPTYLTLAIPDITGDGRQEKVVYAWETAADRPLLRTMNDGPAEEIVACVYTVEVTANIRTIGAARVWTSLDVTLQMGQSPHTRLHMGTPLRNRPEVPEA